MLLLRGAMKLRVGLVTAVALLLLASPLAVEAQQTGKVWRIGILGSENTRPWESFRQALRELGYVEGRNLVLEQRWSEGITDRLPALATELVQLRVDVIVASGTQGVRAAMQATRTIPIVMAVSAYPEKIGLVESLARPGGNVTGFSNIAPELAGKRLELLKEIAPRVSRTAYLWNPASPVESLGFQDWLSAGRAIGVQILSAEVRTSDDYPAAFASVASSRAHALIAASNPVNFKHRHLIAAFALKTGIPSIYEERLFVEAGGLMSYAPSFIDLFRRAATHVDKILRGAKPAELPVEQPVTYELVINLKTAKALGLTIPPSLLVRVDQVIE
jgi:putative ABC transport system substrate-binding protein